MAFLWTRRSARTLGAVMEEKQMSAIDKFRSKKYMGVWRWESQVTVTMMRRFPSRVVRYTKRRRRNKTRLSSRFWVRPRKINSLTLVPFPSSMDSSSFPLFYSKLFPMKVLSYLFCFPLTHYQCNAGVLHLAAVFSMCWIIELSRFLVLPSVWWCNQTIIWKIIQ